jgi:undecaprenyl-diphosphatase
MPVSFRPYFYNGQEVLTLTLPGTHAYPSNHTAYAFALSIMVFLKRRRLGCHLLVLSFVVGVARIVANVHYPADIFGGFLIGLISALVVSTLTVSNYRGRLPNRLDRKGRK